MKYLVIRLLKYYFAGASRIATLAPHCVWCSAGVRTGSTLTYLLGDHLGSTSLTTDASGNFVSELRYKPWGETRYSSGTTATSYRYTGQREEVSFGLYFYNARWMDPALGRFVQADSIVPGGVQGLDRYAYVNNSPLVYVDPSGHDAIVVFDNRGWDYFSDQLDIALSGAKENTSNVQTGGAIVGAVGGYLLGGLCGPGITVCGIVTTGLGAGVGVAFVELSHQKQYEKELESIISKINIWIDKINLDLDDQEYDGQFTFSIEFADGQDENGYFYQVYIDGEWVDVSYDVYKTLKETFSDPIVKEKGNSDFFEFEGPDSRPGKEIME
ncbi:MAG: RHS repeat-associated core domain-containing protein [Chloroflexi bacterium]|nr:RHS repeat-associated core domain-containing protein [Chloroflexota bacterium]